MMLLIIFLVLTNTGVLPNTSVLVNKVLVNKVLVNKVLVNNILSKEEVFKEPRFLKLIRY
jgi:hypothetical protein